MATSLKDDNKFSLYTVMAVNLLFFYAVVESKTLITGAWVNLANSLDEIVPAGLGLILTGILNAQLSPLMKSRIVFLRWNNSLPACQAFTLHAKSDPRINYTVLEKAYGPLPIEPNEQNSLWYRLYKTVESETAVTQVHRAYLFTRDYTALALMMFALLCVVGFIQIQQTMVAYGYVAVLLLQFLVTGQAARNHGKRFVTTVLAIVTAKVDKE